MSSFQEALQVLKANLEVNERLQAFSREKWNRELSARIVFRHRQEISVKVLPLIMITRPMILDREKLTNLRRAEHVVRLYAGFYQKDPEKAVLEQVEFEELIDDALMTDPSLGGKVIDTRVDNSINDEGGQHPSYFTLIDLKVKYQRNQI